MDCNSNLKKSDESETSSIQTKRIENNTVLLYCETNQIRDGPLENLWGRGGRAKYKKKIGGREKFNK